MVDMAKKNDTQIVRTLHTVARSEPGLIIPPLIAIGLIVSGTFFANDQLETSGSEHAFDWRYIGVVCGMFLLLPVWAKFKARFMTRYRVTLDSVVQEEGLFSKVSSEIRIQDIRNIVVKQSFFDRLLRMGCVTFSSSAGSGVEVQFHKVSNPNAVKLLIRDIQSMLSDGVLTDEEIAAIEETAGNKGKPARVKNSADSETASGESARVETSLAAVSAPAEAEEVEETAELTVGDESTREELYRLLAEQQPDEK
ncbi:MAG: hypothetical protein ACJAYU_000597 [Bradymonadia bacterium]|jgi:hypothetical protein